MLLQFTASHAPAHVDSVFSIESSGEVFRLRDSAGTVRVKLGASEEGSGPLLANEATGAPIWVVEAVEVVEVIEVIQGTSWPHLHNLDDLDTLDHLAYLETSITSIAR